MKRYIFLAISILILSACNTRPSQSYKSENIDWTFIRIENARETDKPRILIAGDSIAEGYYPYVKTSLADLFYFGKYTTSKFVGDPDFLKELEIILSRHSFDIIHLNVGLHGLEYSIAEYSDGIEALLVLLGKSAPDATIIWCQSTPIRLEENLEQFDKNNLVVKERNKITGIIMESNSIMINDLYAVVLSHPEYYRDDGLHFNDKGKQAQSEQVISILLETYQAPK